MQVWLGAEHCPGTESLQSCWHVSLIQARFSWHFSVVHAIPTLAGPGVTHAVWPVASLTSVHVSPAEHSVVKGVHATPNVQTGTRLMP